MNTATHSDICTSVCLCARFGCCHTLLPLGAERISLARVGRSTALEALEAVGGGSAAMTIDHAEPVLSADHRDHLAHTRAGDTRCGAISCLPQ